MANHSNKYFTEAYKQDLFVLWYNNQKPFSHVLVNMIPDSWANGVRPSPETTRLWIDRIFKPQAEILDAQVARELEQRLVAEKVEMLSRHARIGQEMQDVAYNYLEKHKEELNTSSAVRLLVEGVRIERESRGIPQALEKMMDRSDEELLEEVKKLIGESPVEIMEVLDAE